MKKLLKVLIAVVMVAAMVAIPTTSVSAITQDDEQCYVIATPQDLVDFAKLVNSNRGANAKLVADLDMTGVAYTAPTAGYYGTFDGQGHTISGLTRSIENAAAGDYGLLFNVLGNGYNDFRFGEIMNLTIKDSSITVSSTAQVNVGALTGKCDRHDVYDVSFENVDVTVTGAANSTAGLATGYSCWGSIRGDNVTIEYFNVIADKDCTVSATGTDVWAGSVVGMHDWDPIYFHGCESAATVSAPNGGAGGIIGFQKSGNNPKFFNITVNANVSGAIKGALIGKAAAPDYGLSNITNTTGLSMYGTKTQEGRLNYYDDASVYGKAPATDDGRYMISTAEEFFWFAKFINGDNNMRKIRFESEARLVNDIDMTGKPWEPMTKFRGTLDGQGYTVKGLNVTVKDAANDTKHGLIVGVLGNNYSSKIFGVVKNLTIADSTLSVSGSGVKYNVGGVAGESNRGSFYNVSLKNVDISVTGNLNTNTVVGGIAGWVAYAPENPGRDYIQSYLNCHVDKECSITSDSANVEMGGIFGILGSECVRVVNSTVSATLTGVGNVGGIAGNISSSGNRWYMISDCGFYGNITSGKVSGGVVGYVKKNGYIIDTSVTGIINGETTGELAGKVESGYAVHEKRNSDGTLSVTDGNTIQLYSQTRLAKNGHDLRIILLADMAKMESYNKINVQISFYGKDDNPVKSLKQVLGGADSNYTLYTTVGANDETFKAGENNAIFGNVIKSIPDGAYSYFSVVVTDENGNEIVSGSTKAPEESSLEGKTFYFLGSSVTYGSNSGGKSMADFIAERNNCTTVKEAVSGTTLVTSNDNSYVYRLLNTTKFDKNAKVDHFIVQLSTNDAGQNKPLGSVSNSKNLEDFDTTTVIGAMEYIICYVQNTWNCPVTFYTGTMYNNNNYVQMIMALYDLEEKWGIGVIDMFFDLEMCSLPTADYNRYMSDTVHPNALGYEKWWTPVFEKHLKSYKYD